MSKENLVAWCCMECDENFYLDRNQESTQILGAINCPYCGDWKNTVMNEIKKD
jgi:DNA-directed RNA polymerase subunit RPC12/RpoP